MTKRKLEKLKATQHVYKFNLKAIWVDEVQHHVLMNIKRDKHLHNTIEVIDYLIIKLNELLKKQEQENNNGKEE